MASIYDFLKGKAENNKRIGLLLNRVWTYRSFVGMNMPGKDYINLVLHKPFLIHYSHGFPFHVMMYVAAV